jgi:hypothetical protein
MSLPEIVLDGLGNTIEVPLLTHCVLSPSSKVDIVSTNALSNSFHWKSRSEVEWSVDMESPVFVKTLGWLFLCFININNLPSLLWLLSFVSYQNWLAFSIFTILNIKAFSSSGINVAEVVCFELEELEPLSICAPDLHLVGSSAALDIP